MPIYNPLPYPQTFTWSIQPLPVGGNCTKPGPTFSPSSGTTNAPGLSYAVITTSVTLFGDFLPFFSVSPLGATKFSHVPV